MALKQESTKLALRTRGPGLYEFTDEVVSWVRRSGVETGLLTLFITHTSASLMIQENADPTARRDMERFFEKLVPRGDRLFRHTAEGPDDMPAHVRSVLTATSLSIPVAGGAPVLGTWQGIYLFEHRDSVHRRRVTMHLIGE